MMFFLVNPATASAFTSGTISGTSGSIRHTDELSMTTAPCAAIFGDHSFDTAPPADIKQMSTSEKSKWSSALTFSVLSPNEHSTPWLRREATATTSSAGKLRSARMSSISRPTLPVAPTTATLKPIVHSPAKTAPRIGDREAVRFYGRNGANSTPGKFGEHDLY